jgi:hypothetical protein
VISSFSRMSQFLGVHEITALKQAKIKLPKQRVVTAAF